MRQQLFERTPVRIVRANRHPRPEDEYAIASFDPLDQTSQFSQLSGGLPRVVHGDTLLHWTAIDFDACVFHDPADGRL